MHPENETCVQRVRFFFNYFKNESLKEEKIPIERIIKLKPVTPNDVRELKDILSLRLERIACMMDILNQAHEDWAVTGRKDYISMETETLDYNKAVEMLEQNGYTQDEFVLKVEYTRKWGVL